MMFDVEVDPGFNNIDNDKSLDIFNFIICQ